MKYIGFLASCIVVPLLAAVGIFLFSLAAMFYVAGCLIDHWRDIRG